MTRDLPSNDADNGGPVVPVDQCDEDYYSEASVQERKDRLSAKYGHLRAAAAGRAEEDQRIAEANRRSKADSLNVGALHDRRVVGIFPGRER
jgi:hypothetical protein